LGACLNAALLWFGLRKRGALPIASGWGKYLLQLLVGLSPLGVLLFFGAQAHDWLALQANPLIRIGLLGLWLLGAALVYFATLWMVGLRWQNFLRHAK
jgi:putative peptidoglycan lipid II flippase